ncbi:pseudouridine synthase [Chitinispirillales bacterium ANBcel5]|uniref:pseudouridine synthase n=1 Tax=Cellulosispirillum alkaliphilum TaxID=3039283 RepID=UPI002A58F7F2|nr:pseudouridine synthase [Chitinispirillales bacterium ANBcel5]
MGCNEKEQHNDSLLRLNRYLAMCGLGSRRKADELIAAGRVIVNGKKVTELGVKIDPQKDKVEYMGKALSAIKKIEYLVYYKPCGVIVTRFDPEGRLTIYDALLKSGRDIGHLKYVGRLDYNSEGLLILTNDGEMVHALTHPRYQIKKVYNVRTTRYLKDEEIEQLKAGVMSRDQLLRASEVRAISSKNGQCWYEVVLFEGKNRQIRRMIDAVGHEVKQLKRVQFGSVKIGSLKPGQVRELTEREIGALKNAGYKNN